MLATAIPTISRTMMVIRRRGCIETTYSSFVWPVAITTTTWRKTIRGRARPRPKMRVRQRVRASMRVRMKEMDKMKTRLLMVVAVRTRSATKAAAQLPRAILTPSKRRRRRQTGVLLLSQTPRPPRLNQNSTERLRRGSPRATAAPAVRRRWAVVRPLAYRVRSRQMWTKAVVAAGVRRKKRERRNETESSRERRVFSTGVRNNSSKRRGSTPRSTTSARH
mmetsp:Transcript_40149/g.107609  ORF Transcript_40149/g.107609 Transcript_40149/m.107609 type:complete len:221 (-) Transcript_40149:1681-2343(-)